MLRFNASTAYGTGRSNQSFVNGMGNDSHHDDKQCFERPNAA
jgi:hypothetical protein